MSKVQTSPPLTRSRSRGRPRSRTTPEPLDQGADQEVSGQRMEGRRPTWREPQNLSFGSTLLPSPRMQEASSPRPKYSKKEMAELQGRQSKSRQSSVDSQGNPYPRHFNREHDPNEGFIDDEYSNVHHESDDDEMFQEATDLTNEQLQEELKKASTSLAKAKTDRRNLKNKILSYKKDQEEEDRLNEILRARLRAITEEEARIKKEIVQLTPKKPRHDPFTVPKDRDGGDGGGDDGDDGDDDDDDFPGRRRRSSRTPKDPTPGELHIHHRANPHIPPPPKFDGTPKMSPREWASHMEDYFKAIEKPDGWIQFASLLLMGNAKIWWMRAKYLKVIPADWSRFIEMLTHQFAPIDGNRKAREKLNHLRQTKSVQDYIADFTNLMYQIDDMGEADAFHKFMDGLKPHIQVEMKKREITAGLGYLQTQALHFDELTFSLRNSERFGYTEFRKPFEKKPFDKKAHSGTYSKTSPSKGLHQIEKKEIICFNCGTKGHYSRDCRKPKKPNPNGKKPWDKKKTETPTMKDTGSLNLMSDKDGIHAMQLKVQKKSDSVKIPVRKTPGSAGMDIGPSEDGSIEAGETKQIHTGIAVEIPPNHFIWVHERSSMRDKVQISGIIDSDYRDELLLIVTNHTAR